MGAVGESAGGFGAGSAGAAPGSAAGGSGGGPDLPPGVTEASVWAIVDMGFTADEVGFLSAAGLKTSACLILCLGSGGASGCWRGRPGRDRGAVGCVVWETKL